MDKIPLRLKKDPIVEAIFEIRFSSKNASVANILPGLFYPDVKDKFPKIETLPTANIPEQLVLADPSLKYRPHYRLVGKNYLVLTGEHTLTVSCRRPYTGWKQFRPVIMQFISLLQKTALVDVVERFSIKYINLLEGAREPKAQFGLTKLNIQVCSYSLTEHLTQVRTEIVKDGFTNVVQVLSGASVHIENESPIDGLLIDIDTICNGPFKDFWSEIPALLERAHLTEKRIFFEDILTKETIGLYEPMWEE